MTDAKIIQLQNALVAALNVRPSTFAVDFLAARGYRPVLELPEVNSLSVLLVAASHESAVEDRTTYGDTWAVDCAIQKRWDKFDSAQADALTLLAEQVAERLRRRELLAGFTLVENAVRVLFVPEHVVKFQQFTAVVSTSWRRFVELDDY